MRYLFSGILLVCLALPAFAAGGFQGPGATNPAIAAPGQGGHGGFQGPSSGAGASTVAKAKASFDDTTCVLTGKIISRQAGTDDEYIFEDSTGQIIVDIDREIFAGRTVTPANTVRISGEVDKDMLKPTKIDVKHLEILN